MSLSSFCCWLLKPGERYQNKKETRELHIFGIGVGSKLVYGAVHSDRSSFFWWITQLFFFANIDGFSANVFEKFACKWTNVSAKFPECIIIEKVAIIKYEFDKITKYCFTYGFECYNHVENFFLSGERNENEKNEHSSIQIFLTQINGFACVAQQPWQFELTNDELAFFFGKNTK